MKTPPILSGVAGEYFVAAELSRRGCIASITLRNTRGVDVLASNVNASKSVGIQVKTSRYHKPKEWMLRKGAEDYHDKNLFYVFVDLTNERPVPEYHIVPSKVVADYVKRTHREWLNTPGRNGQPHNDSNMRTFRDNKDKYLGKWELLGLD